MSYSREIRVEFNHCDPAGIVFYPRYFEMLNSVVENFFREDLNYSFARMAQEGGAVPTVHLEVNFPAPTRLGDALDWRLSVARLGRSSVTFSVTARCGADIRVVARPVLVWLSPARRPVAWPDDLRARLSKHIEAA
jgi:4-hydroxybenzoyl-CoA thioesterase